MKASSFLCVCQVQGDAHDIVFHGSKVSLEEDGLVRTSEGPWMENSHQLKPCWSLSQPGIYIYTPL